MANKGDNKKSIVLETIKDKRPIEGKKVFNGKDWYLLDCLFRKARLIRGRILIPWGSKVLIKAKGGKLVNIRIDGKRVNNVPEIIIGGQESSKEAIIIELPKLHYVETINGEDGRKSVYYLFEGSIIEHFGICKELSLLYELGAKIVKPFAPYPGFKCTFVI